MSTIIANKIQGFYIDLLQLKHLVNCYTFHQQILFFSKLFNSEFQTIEVWFTDWNSQPLEIEDKIKSYQII